MPVNPVTGERLPYPGDPGYRGVVPPNTDRGIEATNRAMGISNGGPPPMGGPMEGPEMGGQADRLSQLLEARQIIDQEIAAIVGGPPGAENLDMLPPPPVNPMAQMPPEAMGAPNGMGGPPMAPPMPPMGPQGLLGM